MKSIFPIITLLLFISSCNRADYIDEVITSSDLEEVSAKHFKTNGPVELSGAKYISDLTARSGKFSLRLDKKNQKALKGSIENIRIGDEIHIQVWRTGTGAKNSELVLIVGHLLYFKESVAIKKEGDWELLEFKMTIPMEFVGKGIRWYVNNKADEEVFFDDFYLRLKRNNGLVIKTHPKLPQVNLKIKEEGIKKIESKRLFALDKGVLITEADDWVKTSITWNDKKKKGKIRLKGDWTDHLYGQKVSLRVSISKGKTLNDYSKFSIQNPVSRYYLDEWFIHKILEKEGILTTRYEFIDLYINDESKGLYAVEEHFTAELLASQGREESPIFKFSEDDLWLSRFRNNKKDIKGLPWYPSAMIEAFSQKRMTESEDLRASFFRGRELMFQYQFRLVKASTIVDTKKMAAYIALMDMCSGYHAMIWHNQRFYYNKEADLLEPLVYDIFQETTHLYKSDIDFLGKTYVDKPWSYKVNSIDFLFQDERFVEWYIYYLEKFSAEEYFENAKKEYITKLSKFEKEIQSEYDFYSFNIDLYLERAKIIREELPSFKDAISNTLKKELTPFYSPIKVDPEQFPIENTSMHAYLDFLPGQTSLQVQNFYYSELEVVGLVIDKKNEFFESKVKLPAYRIKEEPETIAIDISGLPTAVLFKTLEGDSLFSQKVIRYRAPIIE